MQQSPSLGCPKPIQHNRHWLFLLHIQHCWKSIPRCGVQFMHIWEAVMNCPLFKIYCHRSIPERWNLSTEMDGQAVFTKFRGDWAWQSSILVLISLHTSSLVYVSSIVGMAVTTTQRHSTEEVGATESLACPMFSLLILLLPALSIVKCKPASLPKMRFLPSPATHSVSPQSLQAICPT